jgi:hypothetical protein
VFLIDSPSNILKKLAGKVLDIETDSPRAALKIIKPYPKTEAVYLVGESVRMIIEKASKHIDEVRVLLKRERIDVKDVGIVEPTMESAFITIIGRKKKGAAA